MWAKIAMFLCVIDLCWMTFAHWCNQYVSDVYYPLSTTIDSGFCWYNAYWEIEVDLSLFVEAAEFLYLYNFSASDIT